MRLRSLQNVSTDRLVELAEVAKVRYEQWFRDFFRAVALSGDADLEKTLVQVLRPLAVEQLIRDVPFTNPTAEQLREYVSAEKPILYGYLFDSDLPFAQGLNLKGEHTLVAGGTGTGKTNLLYALGLQARPHCAVWFIDKDKQDYRHLLRLWPDLWVLDIQRDFRFNPLEVPEGVKPGHHIASFVAVFTKCNSLLDGSEALLQRVLIRLFEEYGMFAGSTNYPTLHDLLEAVEALKIPRWSREAGFRDSLKNRLESYLAANGTCYGVIRGFSIPELARRSVVLEVKGLSERHVRCLLSWLFLSLFHCRIANHERGRGLQTLVIVDECKHLIPYGYNEQIGFSPMASILAQCREVGMGFVFADQTAQLEDAAFVQTRTKICLRLGSGEDIRKVQRAFALTDEQAAYIPKLDTGQAIVRVPKLDPFLIRIPRVRLR